MKEKTVKEIFDSCFIAKKVTEMMPELPIGMKPRHIHVIDAIYFCKEKQNIVCVSDISSTLNITTPSVTKLINELEKKEIVEKISCEEDKRVTYLELTEYGKELHKEYVYDYHSKLANIFNVIDEKDVEVFIEVTKKIYNLMSNSMKENENGR